MKLYKLAYLEDGYLIDHPDGDLQLTREELKDLYCQLDDYLYPNRGYEPRINVWPSGTEES